MLAKSEFSVPNIYLGSRCSLPNSLINEWQPVLTSVFFNSSCVKQKYFLLNRTLVMVNFLEFLLLNHFVWKCL